MRRGLRVPPFVVGGMQERARRGGIEDVAAIVGFGAAAAELAGGALAAEAEQARSQTVQLAEAALAVEGVERFGDPDERVPHLVCVGIAGVEAEPILLGLDQRGVAAHSGSSCSSEALEPSPVLAAMGVDADHSLRVSVGWNTNDADVAAFSSAFPEVVGKLPRVARVGCRLMTTLSDWSSLAGRLTDALELASPPIAITFAQTAPDGVSAYDAPMPEAMPDGRTGRVAAGCVFWIKATDATFSTVAADHGNCSVGSLTHGLKTLDEVAGNSDVAALLDTGWVTMDVVPQIPVVSERPATIVYGPLADTPVDPDVVLIRVTGKQLMVLHDAVPSMHLEGKPQCHIIAIAKERGEVAASVGCALSRVRTGMPAREMTCAIPGARLAEVLDALATTTVADSAVASYALEDARRFG